MAERHTRPRVLSLHSTFLVGMSCLCAYFMGMMSSYLVLQGHVPSWREGFSSELAPQADATELEDFLRRTDGVLPAPELPAGDVFLLGLTVADSVDVKTRVTMRRSWTKVWQDPAKAQGRAKTLLGPRRWLTDDMSCAEYFRHYFVVSQFAVLHTAILLEAQVERDLLLTELYVFASQTLRFLWGLRWALANVKFHYAVKTDAATFLYVPAALWWLRESRDVTRTKFYSGQAQRDAKVIRHVRSAWFISRFLFGDDVYPTYVASACVLMSRDVARTLADDWTAVIKADDRHPRRLLHIPDIDIGISLYHSSIVPKHLVHVYRAWDDRLCHDDDLIAAGRVPDDVLLRANEWNGFHVCSSG